jgi:hypothetical protein
MSKIFIQPEIVPICTLLSSREKAGIEEWRAEKAKKCVTYFVPGPVVRNRQLYASVRIKKAPRSFSVRLFYGEIDGAPMYEEVAFSACLDQAAKDLFMDENPEDDPFHRLFWELADSLPRNAKGNSGGFKWVSFQSVTEEFTEKFLIIVAMVYTRANELYAERHGDWTDEQWNKWAWKDH